MGDVKDVADEKDPNDPVYFQDLLVEKLVVAFRRHLYDSGLYQNAERFVDLYRTSNGEVDEETGEFIPDDLSKDIEDFHRRTAELMMSSTRYFVRGKRFDMALEEFLDALGEADPWMG